MKQPPRIVALDLDSHDLTGARSWLANLTKTAPAPDAGSNQGSLLGRVQHLIDHDAVANLKDQNAHHSAALEAKTNAAVGLGHRDPEVADRLNDLCELGWQETFDAVAADHFEFANGYLEVVRNEDGNIRHVSHLPARDVWIHLEESRNVFHYEIADKGDFALTASLGGLRFARFGDRDAFMARRNVPSDKRDKVSEVIHFPLNRGRRSPHYGFIDWAAGTPPMELDHCVTQYMFDFFFNGGVPEAILSVLGKKMDDDDWQGLLKELRSHTGIGNRRRLLALNLDDPEMSVQLDKLTVDGQTTGDNQPMVDAQALKILSAHRTPPILAGVTQPGKMGANNEVTNAMMLFQLLVIGPAQKLFSQILACTLGNQERNGDLGLTAEHFLGETEAARRPEQPQIPGLPMSSIDNKGNGLRTILDEIDLGKADTVGRMRMSVSEAQSRGRDLTQGAAERGSDVAAGRGDA